MSNTRIIWTRFVFKRSPYRRREEDFSLSATYDDQVNGVLQKRWVYSDQYRIAAEMDSSGNIAKRFVYGSKGNIPDYFIAGGEKYRIISDQLGSPRLIVKVSDGTIIQRMDHDEFGRVTEDTNPGYLPFGFAGGLYDSQTSLVRFGARDYDPEIGRWTSKDPILFNGGDTNLFGYTWNDPVNFTDPSGLKVFFVSIGGLLSVANSPGSSTGSVASASLGFGFDTDSMSFFSFVTTGKGNKASAAYGGGGFSGGYYGGNKCEFMGRGTDTGFSLGAGLFGGGAHITTSSGKTGITLDFFGPGFGASGYNQSTNTVYP